MDEYLIASSIDGSPDVEFQFSDRQDSWVIDSNGGSYNSGQIQFDLSTFANSNKYMDLRSATLIIPIVLNITSTQALGSITNENAFALSLKNGVYQIINSMSVILSNNEIIPVQSFQNMLINYKILSKFSTNDEANLAASLLFVKDTLNGQQFLTAGGTAGLGICNNQISGTSSNSIETFNPANGFFSAKQNIGRLKRMFYTSYNAADTTNNISTLVSTSNINTISKNNVYSNTTTSTTYHITATIPLRFLHDFFDRAPLMKNAYFRLVINTHLPTTFVANYSATGVMSAPVLTSPFGVCPFMISPATITTGSGFVVSTTPSVVTVRSGIANIPILAGVAHAGFSSCRIYCPLYTFTPMYEQLLLKEPVKNINYNDVLTFNNIINIQPGGTVSQILTPSLSRLRRLLVLPFFSAGTSGSGNGGLGLSAYASPFASEPGNCSYGGFVGNFNVALSGINIYQETKNYRWMNFLEESRGTASLNGGLMTGLSSGLIGEDWYGNSPIMVVDLSRHSMESDEQSKSVQVSFTNLSTQPMDYICFIEYSKSLHLSVELGAIVI